jgi:hypothetical protein
VKTGGVGDTAANMEIALRGDRVAMLSDFVFLRMMSGKECKQAIAEKID